MRMQFWVEFKEGKDSLELTKQNRTTKAKRKTGLLDPFPDNKH